MVGRHRPTNPTEVAPFMSLPANLNTTQLADDAKLFLRRTLTGDFQKEKATFAERQFLAGARRPTVDPLAQDFVSWRRAILWVTAAAMAVHAILGLINLIEVLGTDMGGGLLDGPQAIVQARAQSIIKWVMTILYLRVPLACYLFARAAMNWTELKASRRTARIAWMVLTIAPILLSLIPFSAFSKAPGLPGEMADAAGRMTGLMVGLILVPQVAPIVLGLMNGVIRSSLVLKTLIPLSGAPGWGVVFAAPVYIIVLVTVMVVVNQISGTLLLPLGLAGLIGGPLLYLKAADRLITPCSAADVTNRVSEVRRRAALSTLAGLVLFFICALENLNLELLRLFDLGTALLASSLAFTVVGADFLLALIFKTYTQSKAFHGTEMAKELDGQFRELGAVGLLKLHTEAPTTFVRRPDLTGPPSSTPANQSETPPPPK